MLEQPRQSGRFAPLDALARFMSFCRHEPETGCVIWDGGRTMGRGHHIPYGAFWFEGRRWFAHRWAAKHIHGMAIDDFQVDHCCPNIPIPNTLCVEHVQPLTAYQNRELQHSRRKRMIHLQVGLVSYAEIYGPPFIADLEGSVPFYPAPKWLIRGDQHHDRDPF